MVSCVRVRWPSNSMEPGHLSAFRTQPFEIAFSVVLFASTVGPEQGYDLALRHTGSWDGMTWS